MKKINVWLFVSTMLAIVANPDESEPFWLFVLWGNVLFAIVCKSIISADEKEKRHD